MHNQILRQLLKKLVTSFLYQIQYFGSKTKPNPNKICFIKSWLYVVDSSRILTEKTGQVRVPKGTLTRSYTVSHGFVMYVERQILLVVGGIEWPIGRRPAPIAKSVGVPIIRNKVIH